MAIKKKRKSDYTFSQVPKATIPRSVFSRNHSYKTTFDAGFLIPFYVDEIIPGDTFNCKVTMFARLSTPVFPIMDNLYLDTFYFFVPYRLVWTNWVKFCGEQEDPADSIAFTIPIVEDTGSGFSKGSPFDYMGVPVEQPNSDCSALPLRSYNLIYNTWFRDQNLIDSVTVETDDGPDAHGQYVLKKRAKRHDYFTSCLPWPQKQTLGVTLPLGTSAPVARKTSTTKPGLAYIDDVAAQQPLEMRVNIDGVPVNTGPIEYDGLGGPNMPDQSLIWAADVGLEADLSTAASATINAIREAFQIQKLLERDARGGTRYIEIVKSHYGVSSPDMRHQRPEFLGGGTMPMIINPVAQTAATSGANAQGHLAGFGVATSASGFSKSFTEHGTIIGLVMARADITYQRGMARMWNRRTRYDFYWPALAHLGEQAVLNGEIFYQGDDVTSGSPATPVDGQTFGFQERWSEYRYFPSIVTGLFRSIVTGDIDEWHLAQIFSSLPTLGQTFIEEDPPIDRISAVPSEPHIIFDSFFDIKAARVMPLYSVPGLIDHF